MDKKQQWLKSFEEEHHRKPTVAEFAKAKKNDFSKENDAFISGEPNEPRNALANDTKQQWLDSFEEKHHRKPTVAEFAKAKANNFSKENDAPIEEVSNELGKTLESNEKQQWVKNFEDKYKRKPTVAEFAKAKANDFVDTNEETIEKQTASGLSEETQEPAEKVSNVSKKSNQIKKTIVIPVVCLVIIAIAGIFVYLSMPKSIMNQLENKVSFSGYDTNGIADVTDYSSIIARAVKNQNYPVNVSLSKREHLKNGDKITLAVSAPKGSGIKSETKEIEVSGLKETSSYDIDDLLKKYPVTFVGLNGSGRINPDDETDKSILTFSKESNLSNGDKIKVSVDSYYIEQQAQKGAVFSDPKTKELTVSGLQEISDITNINEIKDTIQSYANAENKNTDYTTYELTAGKLFVFPSQVNYGLFGSSNNTSNDEVTIVRIYGIKETTDSAGATNKTTYEIYGYKNIPLKDNKVAIADLNSSNKYSDYSSYESENAAIDALKADYPTIKELAVDK